MNATELLLLAGHMRHEAKRASMLKTVGGGALDFGLDMLPGIGTYRVGRRAFQDFGQGNWLGGVGNLIGAGATLIPGVGGLAGKGVSLATRIGTRALGRIGAPTLAKGVGVAGRGLAGAATAAGRVSDKVAPALGRGAQSVAQRMPTFGGAAVSRGIGNVGSFAARRPGTTGLLMGGGGAGLSLAGAGSQEARLMAAQQQAGARDLMQNWRSRMPSGNPMMAGGGQNLNYRFA